MSADVNQHTSICSFYTSQGDTQVEEFRADVELVESLYPVHHAIEALSEKIDDTYFAAGSEAYAAALLVYQYAKLQNVATGALDDTLDDLGRRLRPQSQKSRPAAMTEPKSLFR